MERIHEIDLLRGIAISLMIIGHSIIVHPIDFTSVPWCQSLHNWIYSFHMELFFFISGAVYHCEKYSVYLVKKIDRLIVPLIAMGFLNILITSIGGEVVHEHTPFLQSLLNLICFGDPYWFLYTLFLISVIWPLIEKLCPNKFWELGVAVLLIILPDFLNFPKIFRIYSVVYYMPYFFFGTFLKRFQIKEIKPGIGFGVFLLCIFFYFLLIQNDWQLRVFRYFKAFAMIIPAFLLSKMMVNNEASSIVIRGISDFLRQASKYSLQVYMFNGFILVAARTLLVSILHVVNPAVVIPLIVIANFVITFPLCRLLTSKTKWIAWLCGLKACPMR